MRRGQSPIVNLILGLTIILATIALLLLASPMAVGGQLGSDRYDADIRSANDRWLGDHDWRRYKAQLYQESLLDPYAVSPVGAEGIAQFMPGTWDEVSRQLGFGSASPRVADLAIEAGAYYLAGRMATWTSPRPYIERRRLGEACYNAGCGNILEAQRECQRQAFGACIEAPCLFWHEIRPHFHNVTGRHAHETITYIDRIERWWRMLRVE